MDRASRDWSAVNFPSPVELHTNKRLTSNFSFYSDDGSIKEGSLLSQWGDMFVRAVAKGGRSVNTLNTCRAGIEGAGFVNIHEKLYKVPFGGWVKNPVLKEAGYFHKNQILEGLEGYTM